MKTPQTMPRLKGFRFPRKIFAMPHELPVRRASRTVISLLCSDPKSTDSSLSNDVQVKSRSVKIISRRDTEDGWQSVQIEPMAVIVQIADGTRIKVWYDGSVTRATPEDRTTIEMDGSVFKRTEYARAYMSGDGTEMTTEVATHNASITEAGAQSSLDDDWQPDVATK